MNGILPLWKPRGMTSHDCVIKTRRLVGAKKVGHAGTLDPGVEGVLPVCIGEATKLAPYLTNTNKTYIATIRLGALTDTEDSDGQITHEESISSPPSQQTIENVLQWFKGEIKQQVPMYSAVKVDGKKLYEYARENEPVERPFRKVTIYDIAYMATKTDEPNSFSIKVTCGKGTYIRTLCVDIGRQLGYYAHMSNLVRTQSGSIDRSHTITFPQLEQACRTKKSGDILLPMVMAVTHLDTLPIDEGILPRVLNGQKLKKPDRSFATDPFKVMYREKLIALYQIHPDNPGMIKPVRVFHFD